MGWGRSQLQGPEARPQSILLLASLHLAGRSDPAASLLAKAAVEPAGSTLGKITLAVCVTVCAGGEEGKDPAAEQQLEDLVT